MKKTLTLLLIFVFFFPLFSYTKEPYEARSAFLSGNLSWQITSAELILDLDGAYYISPHFKIGCGISYCSFSYLLTSVNAEVFLQKEVPSQMGSVVSLFFEEILLINQYTVWPPYPLYMGIHWKQFLSDSWGIKGSYDIAYSPRVNVYYDKLKVGIFFELPWNYLWIF